MQETLDGRDGSASQPADSGACGVLEDPFRIDIIRDAKSVAYLIDPIQNTDLAKGVYAKDRFRARLYRYQRLVWQQTASILLLQGASVQDVLGAEWIVVEGQPCPVYYPVPGMIDVTLALVLENLGQLSAQHLFLELRQALKL
jgi:hypothetical protein